MYLLKIKLYPDGSVNSCSFSFLSSFSNSSIELSCDGPLRSPFVGFQQGALTYEYGKLGLEKAIEQLIREIKK